MPADDWRTSHTNKPKKRAGPPEHWDTLVRLYPWLKKPGRAVSRRARPQRLPRHRKGDRIGEGSGASGSHGDSASESDGEPEEKLADELPPEADVGEIARHLAEHREEWRWDDIGIRDFYVHDPGGNWLTSHKGKVGDQAIAYARGGNPVKFCNYYGYPSRRGYALRLYGARGAHELAREFCRRGQFYYNIMFNSEDEDFEFTPEQIDSYVDSREFLDFMCALDLDGPCYDAGLEIRTFKPH